MLLLDGVEDMQLAFLGSLEAVQTQSGSAALDTSNWAENWVVDVGQPGAEAKQSGWR